MINDDDDNNNTKEVLNNTIAYHLPTNAQSIPEQW